MKIKKLSIFVLIFILCLSGCAGTKKVKYQSGRDTYLSVGDGRFQMMSSFDITSDNNIAQLIGNSIIQIISSGYIVYIIKKP